MSDWIWVTLDPSGYHKRIRTSAVISYGNYPDHQRNTWIDLNGMTLDVKGSVEELASLLGDDPSVWDA